MKDRIDEIIKATLNEYIESNTEPLLEMARVGFLNGALEVYVHTDDGGNVPHVHVRDAATRGTEFETCISLTTNDYFLHGRYKDTMNNAMAKDFAEFMESPSKNKRYNTNYEYAVDMWNDNNSNVVVEPALNEDGTISIPNYRELNH